MLESTDVSNEPLIPSTGNNLPFDIEPIVPKEVKRQLAGEDRIHDRLSAASLGIQLIDALTRRNAADLGTSGADELQDKLQQAVADTLIELMGSG